MEEKHQVSNDDQKKKKKKKETDFVSSSISKGSRKMDSGSISVMKRVHFDPGVGKAVLKETGSKKR